VLKEDWHLINAEECIAELESNVEGLSDGRAEELLSKYGKNEIAGKKRKPIFFMLLNQFKDFMVIVLLLAAVVSGAVELINGEKIFDSIVIILIVALNAVIGVVQELKAEKSLDALKGLSVHAAKVRRSGADRIIASASLVPGDIVEIEAGDYVPADLRLFFVSNLKVQEAALTGESLAVDKVVGKIEGADGARVGAGDKINMAFSSSLVSYGRGRGVVVSTGMNTEVGRIAAMLTETTAAETPLQHKLNKLGKALGIGALLIVFTMFILGSFIYDKDIVTMFMTAVSLAVAAIPEGLPAIATIVLAIGVQKMVKKNAIVRVLPAVETLGSATVICSDKTGTLTQNKMEVQRLFYDLAEYDAAVLDKNNKTLRQLIYSGALCNDCKTETSEKKIIGDPTEIALVELALRAGFSKSALERLSPRIDEIPFDSERKLMSTVHRLGGGQGATSPDALIVYTKGGVDELLRRCDTVLVNGEILPLSGSITEKILRANRNMATNALRVIAGAFKKIDASALPKKAVAATGAPTEKTGATGTAGAADTAAKSATSIAVAASVSTSAPAPAPALDAAALEKGLTFLGLSGMIDPPRPECKKSVEKCKNAGIRVVMITGDHLLTACAIARELGILENDAQAVSGAELEKMTDETLCKSIDKYRVYARVSPEHKVRIVKAWQRRGEIVAMTGDGVNDAPALKRADIGAAMGIVGTDVAKEAADIILTDDNFATIVSAVEEGRRIYDNIIKAVQFLLSSNIGEILILFVAVVSGLPEPLLPIQLLWINLVTDSLPAIGLAFDGAEDDIMNRPPERATTILSGSNAWRITYQGIMMGFLALTAFFVGYRTSGNDIEVARTMTFMVLALSQLVHVFNIRSKKRSAFRGMFNNIYLTGGVIISAAVMFAALLVPPLAPVFGIVTLTSLNGIFLTEAAILIFSPLLIVECFKLLKWNTTRDE
jgi:Ca2+-transporting ATPase